MQKLQSKRAGAAVARNDSRILDPATTEQVKWYASVFGRDPRDVVNGIVGGSINRMRAKFDEKTRECADASAGIIEEDAIAAARRRREQAR